MHGFTLAESLYILRRKLKEIKNKKIYDNLPNITLSIITGKGLHSPEGKAVLFPNLTKFLKSLDKISVDEKSEPGVIKVTMY